MKSMSWNELQISQCCTQGDIGDAFYVVRTGEASVHVENEDGKKQVAILKAMCGDGESVCSTSADMAPPGWRLFW